jgi:hypothetical protein
LWNSIADEYLCSRSLSSKFTIAADPDARRRQTPASGWSRQGLVKEQEKEASQSRLSESILRVSCHSKTLAAGVSQIFLTKHARIPLLNPTAYEPQTRNDIFGCIAALGPYRTTR